MTAWDSQQFLAAFPAFATTSTTQIDFWEQMAVNSPMGNWFANTATATEQQLLVAHIGKLLSDAGNTGSGQGGAVASASEGSVSVSFATPPVKTGLEYYLSSTTYGQMLWGMLNIASAGGTYIGGVNERSSFRKAGGVF